MGRCLSRYVGPGIFDDVTKERPTGIAAACRVATFLVLAASVGAGCDLRSLAHDDLYGSSDGALDQPRVDRQEDHVFDGGAGGVDGSIANDVRSDSAADGAPDSAVDVPDAAAEQFDAGGDADPVDVAEAETGPEDSASGLTGNLSGVVSACGIRTGGPDAQIAIAGRRKCSYRGKASYFFASLPAGKLKLVAVKDGYERFEADVIIAPAGTTFDIDMTPAAPFSCTNLPPQVACACTDPTCEQ